MMYRRVFGLPGWGVRSPFTELEQLKRQIGRMYNEFSGMPSQRGHAGVFPAVNVTANRDNYFLRAELPGVVAADLDIQATGNTISVAGERKIAGVEESARYHRREREAGKFSRVVSLPDDIDSERVKANMTDGVLTVVVPKAEKGKPRQIAVK
ncbi:MAG: Hsp20/alpha crystallin family protein [Deltaproteobacteria bacterium]|jgi:HSP20 family protein|nr:MAG: Hsp20/alpha crystallin family protein [Deltaproteobacteria bacterium]